MPDTKSSIYLFVCYISLHKYILYKYDFQFYDSSCCYLYMTCFRVDLSSILENKLKNNKESNKLSKKSKFLYYNV